MSTRKKSRKRDSHQTAPKQQGGLDKVIKILTLLLTAATAFFAWQAVQVNIEQNSDNLVVSDLSLYGGEILSASTPVVQQPGFTIWFDDGYLYCSHKVRLANKGGAEASIVGFAVVGKFRDEVARLDGRGEAVALPVNDVLFTSFPLDFMQSIMISEEMISSHPLDASWIDSYDTGIAMPLSVEPHSSVDFIIHNIIKPKKGASPALMILGPRGRTTGPVPGSDTDGFYPMELSYEFVTVSGKVINTQYQECWNATVVSR